MTTYLTLIGLFILLVVREYVGYRERSSLLDRLMSRDFNEYKQLTDTPEENDFGEIDDSLLSIEEAREDIMSPGA